MKKWNRWISLVLSGVLVTGVLTGCGKEPASSEKETTGQAASTVQSEAPASESKETDTGEKTDVVVWSFSFKDPEQQKTIVDGFNKLGTNINIVFKELPQGTNAEIGDKLVTNLIGGEKIDIYDGNVSEYYNFATKGLYEPLNKYYEKDGFDVNALGKSTVDMSKIDGDLYALPYIRSKFILYYNKDIFDAAGEAYPSDDWTWTEFREAAKRLTKGEGADKIWGCTMPDWVCTWTAYGTQSGATFMKDDKTPNLDAEAFKEGLQLKYDLTMVDKSCPSLAENKTTKSHYAKQFSAGNVAMLISGDWTVGQIATNLENNFTFKYDVTNIPHPEGVAKGTTFGASRYVGINAKSDEKTKEAAWEVLKYLASEEVALMMAQTGIAVPAINSDAVTSSFLNSVPEFVTNGAMILEDAPYVEEKAMHPASNIIEKVMQEEAELVLTDAKAIDQAMADMQKRATEEIANSK